MKGSIEKYRQNKGLDIAIRLMSIKMVYVNRKPGFYVKKDAEEDLRKLLIEVDKGNYIEYWFNAHYIKRIKANTQSSRN